MGKLTVTVETDWGWLDEYMSELTDGTGASTVVTTAARRAIDKYIRKDTGNLAGTVEVGHWQLDYTAPYASYVWETPPQIVSPRNKAAVSNPHEQSDVAATVAQDLASYAARL